MLRTFWRILVFLLFSSTVARSQEESDRTAWKHDGFVQQRFVIQGTGDRNNPLRKKLEPPLSGDEVFVRYRLRYDASTVDLPGDADGEFFVCWLDETEGNTTSTHSGGIPNIGLHVSQAQNHFMVRLNSGTERYGPPLEGDRDYLIVARLWKSSPGEKQPFDQLDLWVDPQADQENSPQASIAHRTSLAEVRWMGFSTGRKTEFDDRIEVWDIDIATSWRKVLGLTEDLSPGMTNIPEPPVRTVAFDDVLPILESHCFDCHSGPDAEEGVRLDVLDEVLNQTAPRSADESRLFQLASNGEMPPDGPYLTDEELQTLHAWIDEGLVWDESKLPTPVPETDHWAFQPIRDVPIPDVMNKEWVRTPVDNFIARRHEEQGITPAPEAGPATLRRRLSLDLHGLPVSGELDNSHVDTATIDQMLSDPAYGERWGRHWLDVARWAESNGHQHNRDRPHAWRYRDWVVDAFASNMPYDKFVLKQLAGDELAPVTEDQLIATGFLAAARYSGNELDKEIQRNDILVDIVNTTSSAFLGLTMECAQCHTHKFDPVSIRDYYRFQAFFAKGQPGNLLLSPQGSEAGQLVTERWQIFDAVHNRMVNIKRKQGHPEPIYIIPKSVIGGMRAEEKARFNALDKQIAGLPQTWGFYSPATGAPGILTMPHEMRWPLPRDLDSLRQRTTSLLIRGDVMSRGPEVDPGWPLVFGASPEQMDKPRTALANWMTSRDNPLTARVWVNRIWQWHFGRGLVVSSNDFGTQGTAPSHPDLLDYLAGELLKSDWDTRHIHQLIVNSATYRQSSQFSEENADRDPDNLTYWRWHPRRLEAEAIRDSILAVSGELDRTVGGSSVPEGSPRRSLYLNQKRDNLPDQQMLFDSANGIVSCSRRRVSTTALQPLWLLNSEFVTQAAEKFAKRAGTVEHAIELAYGRPPEPEELAILEQLEQKHGLASVCLAILNSNEFLYVP
ncbi:MAG: PSD1 domain-containing protein [Planctomycetaceae bacterium]|nr:PSD1 domain-containing protein [Planctomycetaceae bacterium]